MASWGYIGAMKTVGIREFKNHLSAYLREVRSGESMEITERGRVVAVLAPPAANDEDPDARAIQSGDITPPENLLTEEQLDELRPTGEGAPDGTSLAILDWLKRDRWETEP